MGLCKWPEGCDNYCEGTTDFCGTHNHQLRKESRQFSKPLKEKTPIQKSVKRIRPRTKKRAAQERVYLLIVNPWKIGKFCGVKDCGMSCEECHHKKGRKGDLLLYQPFWFPVCHAHHTYITENSAWAIENGYSLSRNKIS